MAKITYNTHENQTHTIDVQNGLTVMEGAVQIDIPGIDADCGGGMTCATCHIYVNEEWLDKLPTKEDGEEDMLDMAFEPKTNIPLAGMVSLVSFSGVNSSLAFSPITLNPISPGACWVVVPTLPPLSCPLANILATSASSSITCWLPMFIGPDISA